MFKIHQPFLTALRIKSKFLSTASRLCRIWPLVTSLTPPPATPCLAHTWPALLTSYADLSGAFLPSLNLLLLLPESLIILVNQNLPREHTSYAKSVHLPFSFIAFSRKQNHFAYVFVSVSIFCRSMLESKFPEGYPGPSSVLLTLATSVPII